MIVNTRVQRVELYRRGSGVEEHPWRYFSWSVGEEIELACLDLQIAVDDLYASLRIPLPEESWQE